MLKNLKKLLLEEKIKRDFEDKWINLMTETDTYNKSKETLSINSLKKIAEGYEAQLLIPPGLTLLSLENVKRNIETEFCCVFEYEKKFNTNLINVKFVKAI